MVDEIVEQSVRGCRGLCVSRRFCLIIDDPDLLRNWEPFSSVGPFGVMRHIF